MEILDRMPFMAKNAVFRKLAEINTLTQEEHEKYDSSIKVLRDNIVVYQAAVREGEAKGRSDEKLANAKSLKQNGVPLDIITKSLGLSIAEVSAL